MSLYHAALALVVLPLLGACSSIIEGTTQEIVVNTTPQGADCALRRENRVIGRVNPTPGAEVVEKTKHDMTIKCNKDGFHESVYYNDSDIAGATAGNIILGGGIGWAIDSASGADNKYTTPVNIQMVPQSQAAPAPQSAPDPASESEDAVQDPQPQGGGA